MTLCKTDIERSFTRAAGTYDASVQFQKQCAEEFCGWLAEHLVRCPETILEAGCGTGLRPVSVRPSARDGSLVRDGPFLRGTVRRNTGPISGS